MDDDSRLGPSSTDLEKNPNHLRKTKSEMGRSIAQQRPLPDETEHSMDDWKTIDMQDIMIDTDFKKIEDPEQRERAASHMDRSLDLI